MGESKKIELTRGRIRAIAAVIGILLAIIAFASFKGGAWNSNKFWEREIQQREDIITKSEDRVLLIFDSIASLDINEDVDRGLEDVWKAKFYRERRLRKDYEKLLFIFNNYDRFYIDSFLSAYKYRGNK